MRVLLVLIAVLASGCLHNRHWDTTNTALEATFAAEITVDGLQTRKIVADCQEYNPVIGPCGDRVPLGVYIPLTGILHAAISYVLPPKARLIWQSATSGAEANVIYYNTLVPDQARPTARR